MGQLQGLNDTGIVGGIVGLVIVIGAILAALAPIIFSIASRDVVSMCVSICATVLAGAIVVGNSSFFGIIIAAALYGPALISASIIYGCARIARHQTAGNVREERTGGLRPVTGRREPSI